MNTVPQDEPRPSPSASWPAGPAVLRPHLATASPLTRAFTRGFLSPWQDGKKHLFEMHVHKCVKISVTLYLPFKFLLPIEPEMKPGISVHVTPAIICFSKHQSTSKVKTYFEKVF